MFEIKFVDYDDLNGKEREFAPDNGHGKEQATYLRLMFNGQCIYRASDAMEPEDATFRRDLNWIEEALQRAYSCGKEAGVKIHMQKVRQRDGEN